jgi:hypothetical protein
MVVDSKAYFSALSYYRHTPEARKPIVLAGFLTTAFLTEKDPRLRQRLGLLIEQEKERLRIQQGAL